MKKIVIGNDHAGTELKYRVLDFLSSLGDVEVINVGTDETESVDYPDFAHKVAETVAKNVADLGILICGSGNGVAITANKNKSIRAALCWTEELASLAREHNDANVLCLPARFVSEQQALNMVSVFLKSVFEGGRHKTRINKI